MRKTQKKKFGRETGRWNSMTKSRKLERSGLNWPIRAFLTIKDNSNSLNLRE
jgi:hypothetical protein